MADARFEDGAEAPLRLEARDADDLRVIAALVQDAVFAVTELRWSRRRHEVAILLNRFRWEDRAAAERAGRGYERVQALILFRGVLALRAQGLDPADKDVILSLLDIAFEPGPEGAGRVVLMLAGDGALALEVEALEVVLADVTRPYLAPSGKAPDHGA